MFACDSTVTPEKARESLAIAGTSPAGIARRSKKLLALYSFNRAGRGSLIPASTRSSCAGSAPTGVAPSMVYCQRSQNEQVNGHSAPERKTVSARSTVPSGRRSSSITEPCAA